MKPLLRIVPMLLIGLLTAAPAVLAQAAKEKAMPAAETKAVKTMAMILMNLNHFAGDADKKQLQDVIADKATTADEKTVAQALLGVQHKVADADKPKLQAIVDSKTAAESVKTLASVIIALNHTASAAEKEKLKKIAG